MRVKQCALKIISDMPPCYKTDDLCDNSGMEHPRLWVKISALLIGVALAIVLLAAVFDVLQVAIFSLLGGVAAVMLPQAVMLWMAQRRTAAAAFALWMMKFIGTLALLALLAVALQWAELLSAAFLIGGATLGIVFNIAVLTRQVGAN